MPLPNNWIQPKYISLLKRQTSIHSRFALTIKVFFHELARSAESLNRLRLLLPDEQLPPLAIAFTALLNERRQRHFVAGTTIQQAQEEEPDF
jgi:hypothetical protein